MLTLTRDTKRLTIVVIYIFLLLGVGTGIYLWLQPDPNCFDSEQNQDEQGIDCGGICAKACIENVVGQALVIEEAAAFPTDDGVYDAVARVTNPNPVIGAKTFRYVLALVDGEGIVLAQIQGESWALPRETKTLLAFHLETSRPPVKTVLTISDVEWTKLTNYDIEPRLGVYREAYTETRRAGEFGVATGLLVNESEYDFRLVTIKVVLRDAGGRPLAINQTDRRTFLVGEQHDFRLTWAEPFGGAVAAIDVTADADVYRSENFLKRYLPANRSIEAAR